MYEIRSRDLKARSFRGNDAPAIYEEQRHMHLNKKFWKYGDVLVTMKRVKVGFSIRLKLFFRMHWYWKPVYEFKHNYYFHWLFFMIWWNPEYQEVVDEIVKDHLAEMLTEDI